MNAKALCELAAAAIIGALIGYGYYSSATGAALGAGICACVIFIVRDGAR